MQLTPVSPEEIPELVGEPTEQVWNLWFSLLPKWDQRTVHKHELEWHDLYLNGTSFKELRAKIRQAQGLKPELVSA